MWFVPFWCAGWPTLPSQRRRAWRSSGVREQRSWRLRSYQRWPAQPVRALVRSLAASRRYRSSHRQRRCPCIRLRCRRRPPEPLGTVGLVGLEVLVQRSVAEAAEMGLRRSNLRIRTYRNSHRWLSNHHNPVANMRSYRPTLIRLAFVRRTFADGDRVDAACPRCRSTRTHIGYDAG